MIVIDPKIRFGRPVVEEVGISTSILRDSYFANERGCLVRRPMVRHRGGTRDGGRRFRERSCSMNFFFDANISIRISKMLAVYNEGFHEIVHITQHKDFMHNNTGTGGNTTPDEEFLEKLSGSGRDWKIISGDNKIITTAHQKAALIESGLTFFCLDRNWSKAKASEQAWKIVKIWDDIVDRARKPGQSIYEIRMGRSLNLVLVKGSHKK